MQRVQHKLLTGKKHMVNGLLLAKKYVFSSLEKTPIICEPNAPLDDDEIKPPQEIIINNIEGGGIANDMYFKFMWRHYLSPILERRYDEIGATANQQVVNVIRNRLLFSENIVDKVLVNILAFSINIGFIHTQNASLRNRIDDRNAEIHDLKKNVENLNNLLYGPQYEPTGNAKIKIEAKLEETNLLKHYTNLSIYLGLYFFLFGYDGESALNKNYYILIKQIVDMHTDKIYNGIHYNTEYMKSKLIESIDTGKPFEIFNDINTIQ